MASGLDGITPVDVSTPSDTPVTPRRVFRPGLADPVMNMVRAERLRERQKREANRPTGTEVGQVSRKLTELTAELKAQQGQLRKQQEDLAWQERGLEKAQEDIKGQQQRLQEVVDGQGSLIAGLDQATGGLQSTDRRIDRIEHTLWDNQKTLQTNIDNLSRRVSALETHA